MKFLLTSKRQTEYTSIDKKVFNLKSYYYSATDDYLVSSSHSTKVFSTIDPEMYKQTHICYEVNQK